MKSLIKVYRFSGESKNNEGKKDDFVGFVAAIPENLTTPEKEPAIDSTPKKELANNYTPTPKGQINPEPAKE